MQTDITESGPLSSGLGPKTGPGIFQLGQPTQII